MILGWDMTGVSAPTQLSAEVVVVVAPFEKGKKAKTIKLGKAYADPAKSQIAMTPVDEGVAVLVWGQAPAIHYVSESGVSKTVVWSMLPISSNVEPYGKYYGGGAISTVLGKKVAVISKIPESHKLPANLVTCTPEGCGAPRDLSATWKEGDHLESGPLLCLSRYYCALLVNDI